MFQFSIRFEVPKKMKNENLVFASAYLIGSVGRKPTGIKNKNKLAECIGLYVSYDDYKSKRAI